MENIILWISASASVAVAIATTLLAYLTHKYVKLTNRILEHQNNAYVTVSLEADKFRPTIFSFFIRNLGKTIATDVHFSFSEPMPQVAWEKTHDDDGKIIPMSKGGLACGIPSLAPGEEREITYGTYESISTLLEERTIYVTCTFDSLNKKRSKVICPINISSFQFEDAAIKGLLKIERDLGKIKEAMVKIATKFR